MGERPEVSVVMGVYNGGDGLAATLDSVLSQEGVDLEIIAVDDGSTDGSRAVLRRYAAVSPKLRVVEQQHSGLTAALIRGCAAARGTVIARQDAGDRSLPGRLRGEHARLAADPGVALVSCGSRFVGPFGELLYESVAPSEEATAPLLADSVAGLRGPAHHGSTLFRRALYERVGGYRPEFYFAQDLDLWTRLGEVGRHIAMRDVLYEARFSPASITGLHRRQQVALARTILRCRRLRQAGKSEAPCLRRASRIHPRRGGRLPRERAEAFYFIGACIGRRDPAAARRYYREAVTHWPLHWRSWMRLLLHAA